MPNLSDKSVLLLIQPWSILKANPEKYSQLLEFIDDLKERGVYIVYHSFSMHLIPEIYDKSDFNVIFYVDDPSGVDLEAFDDEFQDKLSEELEVKGSTSFYDPYEEADKWAQEEHKSRSPWQQFSPAGNVIEIRSEFKKQINQDITDNKTKILELKDQGHTSIKETIGHLEEIGEDRDIYGVVGGWGNDCIMYAIDGLSDFPVHIRLISKLIVINSKMTYEDWLDKNPGSITQMADDLKFYKLSPRGILSRYFS